MSDRSYFCITARFLDPVPRFHGRREGDAPEWPPSPLRLYQALLAAASRQSPRGLPDSVRLAFAWLEGLPAPRIVAPPIVDRGGTTGYRLSVPNNAMDIVAAAWSRGNESGSGDADPRTHRTMKTVRPIVMRGSASIHYAWLASRMDEPIANALREAAKGLVALGWGIDLVAGEVHWVDAEELDELRGEHWRPGGLGKEGIRVPIAGTMDELLTRYRQFLSRIRTDSIAPLQDLTRFRCVDYRRSTDVPTRRFAAFKVLKADASGLKAFDSARRGLTVAGRMRHAMGRAAVHAGWEPQDIAEVVMGHGSGEGGRVEGGRFSYLPMPTIETRDNSALRVSAVRRCMVVGSGRAEEKIAWAQKALSGAELIDEASEAPVGLLSLIPSNDPVTKRYVDAASVWTSVTPVVLPGFDDIKHCRRKLDREEMSSGERRRLLDRLEVRVAGLLRKAIVQSGLPKALAEHAYIECRHIGFLAGLEPARSYGVPDHLRKYPRGHVLIHFRDANDDPISVSGPICLGGGRFYGIGLCIGLRSGEYDPPPKMT